MRGDFSFKYGKKTPDPVLDGYAHTAAFFGDMPRLEELFDKHQGTFCKLGPHQWTPMMVAALAGREEVVSWMIDHGFAVEERDAYLRTAVHYAAKHGHTHVMRQLVQRGADLDRMDELQRTCLIYAADSNNLAMIGCLLSGGADPDTSDQRLRTPLHYLTEWRHEGVEAILQLCFTGADPNLQDLHGWAPLHMAASMGQPSVCRALLEMGGADPSIRDQDGLRPADLAKTPAVRNMFKAAPWHSYQLKRLRCMAVMKADEERAGEGGDGVEGGSRHARHIILYHRLSQERALPAIHFVSPDGDGLVVPVLKEVLFHLNSDLFTALQGMLWATGEDGGGDCGPSALWS